MKVDIISYDVWGNEQDGFEVNDAHKIDVTELSEEQWDDEQFILEVLISLGHILPGTTLDDLFIDGNECALYIDDARISLPLYELRVVDE